MVQGPRRGTGGMYGRCLSLKQGLESLSPPLPWSLLVSFQTWAQKNKSWLVSFLFLKHFKRKFKKVRELPCLEGFEALVAWLLFQTAYRGVTSSRQGHGTQHQAGDGLHCQHIQLGTLQVLLEKWNKKLSHNWELQKEKEGNYIVF